MNNGALTACLPWLLILVFALVAARILIAISGARFQWKRPQSIHACQQGSAQSLSFVLTLPFFMLVLMLILQVSQIMIANVVVHYSAFAAARSVSVWVPANYDLFESANRISSIELIQETSEGSQYLVRPDETSFKVSKVRQAAVLACAPLAPSRNLGYASDINAELTSLALAKLYSGLDAESNTNPYIAARLRNKVAYSDANTELQIKFWHRVGPFPDYQDPPLQTRYWIGPHLDEFYNNELGWQDEITTSVTHRLALLPGPVRLISRLVSLDASNQRYTYPVTASATMVVEGEKPVIPYWQEERR